MTKPTRMRFAWLSLVLAAPGIGSAAELLAYYDFDDPSDPTTAPAAGGIAPAAAITAPAAFSADSEGHSGVAGDLALDLGDLPNTGALARVPSGPHFDLATTRNAMAVSFWQLNVGDGLGGFYNSSTFWIDSPEAAADGRGFQVHAPFSNNIFYFDQSGCCGDPQRLTVNDVITANTWQHIVVQRDDLGNQEIWIDGVMVANSVGAEALDPFSGILTLGANGAGNNNLTGRLDEFAVYAGTLTETEIGQLADGTANPSDLASAPADADNDGLPDYWEELYDLSTADGDGDNGPDGDPDMDGLTNAEEFEAGLEPNNDDFDEDGLLDGVESNTGVYVDDTNTGTDPKNPDSDGDGILDGVEVPTESFVDANQPGTDPNKGDTDDDGFPDLLEIDNGSDPTDSGSIPEEEGLALLAYYNFDGQSLDQSDNNAPEAVLGGPATLTTGDMGFSGNPGDESLDLGSAGDGSHAQTTPGPHLDLANINNAISVSFWQYRVADGSTSSFWITAPLSNDGERGFQAHVPWGNNTIYFDQSGCCGPPQRLTIPSGSTLNTWQHYVFQRDATGFREIWIDGVLAATADAGEPLDPFNGVITIGARSDTSISFGGRIDDFAIFSDALTEEQIAELSSGANPPDLLGPAVPFVITRLVHDPVSGATSVTWASEEGEVYAIDSSDELDVWVELDDSVNGLEGETTFNTTLTPGTPRRFFRIRRFP